MRALSEQAEHFLCQEFALMLAVPQSRLEKTALLDDLFPPDDRRRIWREAEAKLGLRLPPLHLSPRAAWLGFGTAIGNAVRVAALCAVLGMTWAALPLALAAMVVSGWLFYELSRPWAVWNRDLPTYGELLRWVVAHNAGRLRRRFGIKLTRAEIFDTVRAILVEQLGVRPEEVQWDTRLVDLTGD